MTYSCPDHTLNTIPADGDVPDKAHLSKETPAASQAVCVYLRATMRNIQYWPFMSVFQANTGLYLETGLHLAKWKIFINMLFWKISKAEYCQQLSQ